MLPSICIDDRIGVINAERTTEAIDILQVSRQENPRRHPWLVFNAIFCHVTRQLFGSIAIRLDGNRNERNVINSFRGQFISNLANVSGHSRADSIANRVHEIDHHLFLRHKVISKKDGFAFVSHQFYIADPGRTLEANLRNRQF